MPERIITSGLVLTISGLNKAVTGIS